MDSLNSQETVPLQLIRNSKTASYSIWISLIYIFNLIVGTGALTLPSVFKASGWLLGVLVLILLAFISYITVTFIIESIACANAIKKWQNTHIIEDNSIITSSLEYNENETTALIDQPFERDTLYSLNMKFELADMATLFLSDILRLLFYLVLSLYLYGDLTIYAAAVAKSLRDVTCSNNSTAVEDACFVKDGISSNLTRKDVYQICLICFSVIISPFSFFNLQKTKILQLFTIGFRLTAFFVMIILSINRLIDTSAVHGHPHFANLYKLPSLIGACIYSFMCHHSVPALIQPINKISAKKRISTFYLPLDYIVICIIYLFFIIIAIYAFEYINELFTLNFIPASNSTKMMQYIEFGLMLFPVLTLGTNFPIVSITLRNNLKRLFLGRRHENSDVKFIFFQTYILPLLTILPPIFIAYKTENLTTLITFTSLYAGNIIQYVIPVIFLINARRICQQLFGNEPKNIYKSPFQHTFWILFIFAWASFCAIIVSMSLF